MEASFLANYKEHIHCFDRIREQEKNIISVGECCVRVCSSGKILIAGNGGSAADAQHFAAELVGRFQVNRHALPCIALNTDTSNLTAIGNDFGFDEVFARQVEAIGRPGDAFIGISTSGNSVNIITAVREAKRQDMVTIGLLGHNGGKLAELVDHAVVVQHDVTARIQEAHIFILHYWACCVERSIL